MSLDFSLSTQTKSIESFIRADIAKHRLNDGHSMAIDKFHFVRIDTMFHPVGIVGSWVHVGGVLSKTTLVDRGLYDDWRNLGCAYIGVLNHTLDILSDGLQRRHSRDGVCLFLLEVTTSILTQGVRTLYKRRV